jgi:flagellar biosynthesis chaperone FliJ
MTRGQVGEPKDLRGFRWNLQPVERRFDTQVETARLALARLHQQVHALEQAQVRRSVQQREQESLALQAAQRDVLAGARAMRYLARLEGERVTAEAVRAELRQRVALARRACADSQRQLESVQALRRAAQREYTQACQRRDCREADAAWLAFAELGRNAELRKAREVK